MKFKYNRRFYGKRRFWCLSFLSCILVLLLPAIALGQSLPAFNNQNGTLPPDSVIRYGNIEAVWIRSPLNGDRLFQVAAPTVTDRSNLGSEDLPVEVRAKRVEALLKIEVNRFHNNVLQRLAKQLRLRDTDWLPPRSAEVITATLNNRPVIQIKSSDRSRPLTIITITQTDIDFYSETSEVLSEEWRTILQREINTLEQLSSLESVHQGLRRSLFIGLGLAAALSVFGVLYWLAQSKYHRTLHSQTLHNQRENPPSQENTSSVLEDLRSNLAGLIVDRSHFLEILKKELPLQRKLNTIKSLQWLLFWLSILAIYVSLVGLTYTLPMIASWRITLLRGPFRMLSIWFAVSLALRLNRAIAYRRNRANQNDVPPQSSEAQRRLLRMNTIGGALEGLVTVFILLTGLILTFSTFGLSAQSVLAWGAVLGLAVSFGTQSLIKDMVNGCLILLEDQFAVGDVVAISSMSGLVEEMNLRSTRIRDLDGELITIPNGNIAEVRNLTRLWSRVNFTIEVAYDNDPDMVLKLLDDIAQEMYTLPDWREKMINPPEVLGIDQLSHSGIVIRVLLKTAPLQQWTVGREYRLRVRRGFGTHGIAIGRPQWVTYQASLEPPSVSNGNKEVNAQDEC